MLPNWIYYILGKKSGGGSPTPPTPTPTGVVIPQGMKFRYSSALPENWENWDFSNINDFSYMFGNVTVSNITFNFPILTSNSISFNSMFRSSNITECVLNFNNNSTSALYFVNLFYECNNLESVEINNVTNINDVSGMFYRCRKLVTAPYFDTSSIPIIGNGFSQMFYQCTILENVPIYDFSGYNSTNPDRMPNLYQMFYGCTSLTNQSLDNILQSCLTVISTTASNRNLHYMGLTTYDSIIPTLPHYQDFINAGWTIS